MLLGNQVTMAMYDGKKLKKCEIIGKRYHLLQVVEAFKITYPEHPHRILREFKAYLFNRRIDLGFNFDHLFKPRASSFFYWVQVGNLVNILRNPWQALIKQGIPQNKYTREAYPRIR